MIVRLMGEGQYLVEDDVVPRLNEIDNEAVQAVEAGDENELHRLLEQLGAVVREEGEQLEYSYLGTSDLVVPPPDLSLDEAKELFSGEGLIPDLPV